MIKGSCLCGRVRYSYEGDINEVSMCHCSQCRKAQGTAFAANSPLQSDKLTYDGTEFIKEFACTGDKVRAFCSECGSPLYSAKASLPNIKRVRLGSVETPFTCPTHYHIYTDSTASWFEISDGYKQFEQQKSD